MQLFILGHVILLAIVVAGILAAGGDGAFFWWLTVSSPFLRLFIGVCIGILSHRRNIFVSMKHGAFIAWVLIWSFDGGGVWFLYPHTQIPLNPFLWENWPPPSAWRLPCFLEVRWEGRRPLSLETLLKSKVANLILQWPFSYRRMGGSSGRQ